MYVINEQSTTVRIDVKQMDVARTDGPDGAVRAHADWTTQEEAVRFPDGLRPADGRATAAAAKRA